MKFNNFNDLQIELVEWVDISEPDAPQSWLDKEEIEGWLDDGDCLVDQVGYVIYENDQYIVMAASIMESYKAYSNVTKIPKVVIKRRVKWGEAKD